MYDENFWGPGARWMGRQGATAQTQEIVEDIPAAKMWVTSVRIGQFLIATTGLSAQLLYRYNFNSEVRYLTAVQSVYTTEDELFDDPYSYKGKEFSVSLTQLFPGGVQGTLSYTVTNKFYPGHLALDLDGKAVDGSYRSDKLQYFYTGLEKSFSIGHVFSSQTIFLNFYRVVNRSNDLYYTYRRSLFSAGLTLNY